MTEDERRFTALVERHRRELQVHRHRMLGSCDESEDWAPTTGPEVFDSFGRPERL